MARLRMLSSLALASFALVSASALRAEPRAVIELFTSQGCSSCPAADRLLAEFAHDPTLLTMTLAVDYWDYLGWKDTLALHGHASRQRAYAAARGDREVYTPQAVINGIAHAVGSDKAAIERAIETTHKNAALLTLPVTLKREGEKVTVTIAEAPDHTGQGEVWLCPITRAVPVVITRGENRGRNITYTNVVRRWIKLGDWTGTVARFEVPLSSFQNGEIDEAAVIVQRGVASAPKVMLGAAHVPVR